MVDWSFAVGNSVINRYVRSLYAVAAAIGEERKLAQQLSSIKEIIISVKNHRKFLTRISLIKTEGRLFIDTMCNLLELSNELKNFLTTLLHNNRLSQLIGVCDAYPAYVDYVDGKKMFYVTVAKSDSVLQIEELKGNLQEVFGGSIECIVAEDSSLIGGLKIQYRSKILDYSVKSRLRRLHSAMRKEDYGN